MSITVQQLGQVQGLRLIFCTNQQTLIIRLLGFVYGHNKIFYDFLRYLEGELAVRYLVHIFG